MKEKKIKLYLTESWKNKSDAEYAKFVYKKMDKSIIVRIRKDGIWYNVYTSLKDM